MKHLTHSSPSSPTGWHRFRDFCILFAVCLVIFVGILSLTFIHEAGLILLYLPFGIGFISLLGPIFWFYRYRNGFESFLIYITLSTSLFTFLIMGPFVVERSLSCFIYFKAVEDGSVFQDKLPNEFMESFIQKRFDDGVKGNFLTKQGSAYLPTHRAQLFYAIYYPLGILTNTLNNYQQFKKNYKN
ncbi:MAG: hypothetical protein IKS41_04485 [Alphaproteobacteria bacterium]|nr:hypothetical protein [Alphaproteobacteria bacterium]